MPERREERARPGGEGRVQVEVVLHGNYGRLLPPEAGGRTTVDVPVGATVCDVLDALAVPQEGRTFLTLDGERVTNETPAHDGAELRVIVPLGGG